MLVIWKLRARPRRLISNGVRPSMRWPLSRISPLLGPKRPLMRLNRVDLPAPFGPMIATRSPGRDRELGAADDLGLAEPLVELSELERVGRVRHAGSRCLISASISPWARLQTRTKARRANSSPTSADREHRRRDQPAHVVLGIEGNADEAELRAGAGIELDVIDHLDQRRGPRHHQQAGEQQPGIGPQQARELAELGDPHVHHHQAGDAAGRIHHHEQEDQAEVEQPGLGHLRKQHRGQHQQDRADHRPEEEGGAAEEGEQQVAAGAGRAERVGGVDDLEVDRRQGAADAGEEAGDDEAEVAHPLRVVADELDPLGVVAHGVEHPAERRLGQREHQRRRDEAVGRDQVVDLDLRPEGEAEQRLAVDPVGGDAALAAEEAREHQRHRRHQLADAERDHGEGGARLLGGDVAEQRREEHAGEAADQRDRHQRQRQLPLGREVHRMDGDERAEAGVDGVAEAQHAALAEQDVVAEADDDQVAHLRQHAEREAAAKDVRQHAPGRRRRRSRSRTARRPRGAARAAVLI